ncbi:MAG: hypothetical protein ACYC0F_18070 [Rhodanobacter sp.]
MRRHAMKQLPARSVAALLLLSSILTVIPTANAAVVNSFTCAVTPPTTTQVVCAGAGATFDSTGANVGQGATFTGSTAAKYTSIAFDVTAWGDDSPPSIWNVAFCQEITGGAPCLGSCFASNGAWSCLGSLIYTNANVEHHIEIQLTWAPTRTFAIFLDGSGTPTATGTFGSTLAYLKSAALTRPTGNRATGEFINLAMTGPDGSSLLPPAQSFSTPAVVGANFINFDLSLGYEAQVFLKENSATADYIHKMDKDLSLITQGQPCLLYTGGAHANIGNWVAYTREERLLTACQNGSDYEFVTLTPDFQVLSHKVVSPTGAANQGPISRVDSYNLANIAYDAPSIQRGYAYDYVTNTREADTGASTTVRDVYADKFSGVKWISSNAAGASLKAFDAETGTNTLSFNGVDVKFIWAKNNAVWFTGNTGTPGQTLHKYTRAGAVLNSAATYTDGCAITAFTVSYDEKYAFIACDYAITVRQLSDGAVIQTLYSPTSIAQLQVDIANNRLYGLTPGAGGIMRKWDLFAFTVSSGGDSAPGTPNPPPAAGSVPTTVVDHTGGVAGTGLTPGGPLASMRDFFAQSWGIAEGAANWFFSIIIIAVVLFAVARVTTNPIVLGAFILLATGLCVMIEFLSAWVLLTEVFLILAFAANRVLENRSSGE